MLLEKLSHTLSILIIFLLVGCSSMPSGQYVVINKVSSLKTISKKYNTPVWKLEKYNKNKKIYKQGEWVFIPKNWGIASHSMSTVEMHRFFAGGDFLWPVPSSKRISSSFGKRWGRKHEGIDIAARKGSFIIAVKSGKVVFANWIGGYGKVIVLGHANGLFTVYAHTQKFYVHVGNSVSKGEVIAKVGMTGRTTGPHLHFEVRYDSKAINPLNFFASRK